MANYNVDIAVGIKNAQALKKFNKEVKETSLVVKGLNEGIRKGSNAYEKSLSALSKSLQKTKVNINNAAVGTDAFRKSALDLVRAEKSLNKELELQNKLLEQLRKNEDQFGVAQSSSSNRVRRNVAESRRSRISSKFKTLDTPTPSIDLRNRVRENIRQSRISRFGLGSGQTSPITSGFLDFSRRVEDGSFLLKNQRDIKTNVLRNIRESQRSRIGAGFRSLSLSGQTSPVGEKIARALENEKKLVKEVKAMRDKASKKRIANTKRQLALEKRSNAFVKKAIKEETALRKKAEAEENKIAQKRRARRQKFGSTASSAIIGGAFPLLFGQTGAAAVGGGIGGAAGGLIGGQFGFALSILGTAIGSAIDKNDKFNQSLAALNVRFSDVSGSAQLTSEDIDKVARRLKITKEEAFGVLGAFAQFGSGSIATSLTEIFGSDAAAFNSIATANRQAQLANQIFETRTKIGNEVATQLLQQNLITDSATIELALAEARAKAENDIAVARAKQITFLDRFRDFGEELLFRGGGDPTRYGEGRAEKLQKEFEEGRNKRMKDFKEALEQVRQMLALVNEANGQFGQSGVLAISAINDKVKDLQDEMKALRDPIRLAINLSDVMGASFEESFKGIVKGTMTVADAFRSMLNRIADVFLDTAARMLANQFQQGILGLLGNIFNPFTITGGATNTALSTTQQVAKDTALYSSLGSVNTFPAGSFANGGYAQRGKSYIVGERGAELFTPGAVGGQVSPMGSTNIVVNVDASGSSVEGDEEQGRELGRMISVAIQSELIKQKRPGGMLA